MSRIDDLIAESCQDGVEFKALGDIGTYTRGVTYNKHQEDVHGPIHILRSNNIMNRPGSGGGSQSMEDESHGSTQEVPLRVA